MMYLGIIGKWFNDAGLRDILIQSQVYLQPRVPWTRPWLERCTTCSVRSCKLVYEALHRLLIGKMEASYKNDQEKHHIIASCQENIASFSDNISTETFSYLADTESFKSYNNLLNEYMVHLSANEGLAKFWLSFLDMVELLLNIIYACRAGKWELLLECIKDVAAYAFAYDNSIMQGTSPHSLERC